MADKARKNPNVQKIIQDAQLFDGLQEHVGWRRLYQKVVADKARFMANLASRLMSGEKVSDDEILAHRFFYLGAEWVLGHPEEAFKSLEAAARRAWQNEVLEAITSKEEDTPYA